jgi:hypothetical protein
MENTGSDNIRNDDAGLIPSRLGRWGTAVVFAAIIAIAAGALFLDEEGMAHTPIVIGVCTFDSARAGSALDRFADFCRGKGCGDIRWRYLSAGDALAGCDFYLTTSLEISAPLARGELGCALIAAEREAHRYSRSSVIVKAGAGAPPASGARIIFCSDRSAAGFLAPYRALERSGFALAESAIDFAGSYPGDERVVFGVIYGVYDAGGVSLERLRALEAAGIVREGEIEVLFEGEAFPEIVVAYNPASYRQYRVEFARRLPGVLDRAPRSMRGELAALGIAGLYAARACDLDIIEALDALAPSVSAAARPAGGAAGGRGSVR